jgi:hypothetical protein
MPGRPTLVARLAMMIEENTAMAPTERSMPAVRMIRVCPSARTAMTVTCASTRDRFAPDRKRGFDAEKATIARISTASGPSVGLACNRW